jgi:hypothetical protein
MRKMPMLLPRAAWLLLLALSISGLLFGTAIADPGTCTSDAAVAAAAAAAPPPAEALHVQDDFLNAELRDSLIQVTKACARGGSMPQSITLSSNTPRLPSPKQKKKQKVPRRARARQRARRHHGPLAARPL